MGRRRGTLRIVDVERARTVLGVAAGASLEEVRAAFRTLVRTSHPDIAGATGSGSGSGSGAGSGAGDSRLATERTVELIDAYRLLRAHISGVDPATEAAEAAGAADAAVARADRASRSPGSPGPTGRGFQSERITRDLGRGRGVRVTVDGDTVAAPVPSNELFAALYEAGHGLGEVAYADRSVGLLELIVEFEDGPVCSVLLTLQGRAAGGITEAFVTVEALTQEEAPPAAAVARLVASRLRAHLR